ncbi:MAG: hypothetical protein A3G39_10415 [Deltaproteobacteria bacterium RIFCSPLOWO2_12_FULL_43_16]|nr:MAG: hypothetical protein A2Z89_00670 [Deltaproteobacteria bacterium GWA2_43_19]OGQ09171.1 MAG: hypothetical protein A3D30_09275 [Deltaproteobacteria bacterium RIFCSPHIGHO2_02_FULL_43_33]OGQ34154.1 MAG: hypothetical protein A3A85_02095 [Deltaproteobacteria bacterium RIFCSPLOWO2_01_FULL_42_9]OGQ61691.1 MAG: hypothetical protein A3G39_10415 [Deltaproteobacteria bacterium RIFCSPLOWO2_12_FULL_43_16]HBR17655.1 DUF507 domain-containing protein [Deltaproteobacteria bacterium]
MRLSEDRISHLAHLITDGIWNDDLVDFVDEDKVLHETKKSIADYLKIEDGADNVARNKIRSLSKPIPEGSKEWEVLYKKYYQEELDKKRF